MKKGSKVLGFIREVTIVVIGVVIAVSIGNYKEHLDNKAYLKNTLTAIEKEVVTSQADVDTVLARHTELYVQLTEVQETNEQTLGEFLISAGGFQVAFIKNISLRFFISNKAELLEFDIIAQLLEIESNTDVLSAKVDRLAGFAYENIQSKDPETFLRLHYLLADVIESEQSLINSYEHFLKENEAYFKQNLDKLKIQSDSIC